MTSPSSSPTSTERLIARDAPQVVQIEPTRGWRSLHLGELWAHRELVLFLAWRDVKVRYAQTALGAAWAIVQPMLSMVVFSVFFGHWAKLPSAGAPYPLFVFAGLLPWQLFSQALSQASVSLLANQQLISRVYFPRLVVPLSALATALVDFLVSSSVLLLMMVFYGHGPSVAVLLLPAFVLLAALSAFAAGIWLAALTVRFRDVRHTLPFIVQLWMFATPVVYSSELVPARFTPLFALNPMVGVVDGFRWALLGTPVQGTSVLVACGVVCALLVSGLFYFRRTESEIADSL